MILNYDKAPSLTVDQKIQSLMESVQMALNEHTTNIAQINEEIDNLPDSGGGGDTPVSGSYNDLSDKPLIEGVTLIGSKTFPNLNLNSLTNTEIYDIFENLSV